MKTIQLNITGMHCNGCVNSVTRVLAELQGVQQVTVSLEKASAEIQFEESQIQPAQLIDAIEDAGFDASL